MRLNKNVVIKYLFSLYITTTMYTNFFLSDINKIKKYILNLTNYANIDNKMWYLKHYFNQQSSKHYTTTKIDNNKK